MVERTKSCNNGAQLRNWEGFGCLQSAKLFELFRFMSLRGINAEMPAAVIINDTGRQKMTWTSRNSIIIE